MSDEVKEEERKGWKGAYPGEEVRSEGQVRQKRNDEDITNILFDIYSWLQVIAELGFSLTQGNLAPDAAEPSAAEQVCPLEVAVARVVPSDF